MDLELRAKRLAHLDKKRVEAALSGKAIEYTTLCMSLGFRPEEEYSDLFSQGLKEREDDPGTTSKLEFAIEMVLYGKSENLYDALNTTANEQSSRNIPQEPKIRHDTTERDTKFLREARLYNLNIGIDADSKMRLLTKYFPRFSSGGKDDLTRNGYIENPAKIGAKFKNIVERLEEKYKNTNKGYQQ